MNTSSSSVRPVAILGTGHAVPERTVLSTELDTQLGFRPGSIFKVGGVRKRHFAAL